MDPLKFELALEYELLLLFFILFYTILYLPSVIKYPIVAMRSRFLEPTLYFYILYPPLP
jgi:hypothetical protein